MERSPTEGMAAELCKISATGEAAARRLVEAVRRRTKTSPDAMSNNTTGNPRKASISTNATRTTRNGVFSAERARFQMAWKMSETTMAFTPYRSASTFGNAPYLTYAHARATTRTAAGKMKQAPAMNNPGK